MPSRPEDCAAVLPLLDSWLDGDLSPAEAEGVREHVVRCSVCAAELDLAREIQNGLRTLPQLDAPPALLDRVREAARREMPNVVPFPRTSSPHRFAALAAMLALAVLSALLLLELRNPTPQSVPAAAARAASPEEVARATAEARFALAYVGQVSRRAGLALKDEILPERLLAPAARGVSRSLEEIQETGESAAPRQGS